MKKSFVPLIFSAVFLLGGCVSKPDVVVRFRETGAHWIFQVRGFSPVLNSFYSGNMVYTPKPGYRFFAVHVSGEPVDRPRSMEDLSFSLITSRGDVLSPQFREAFGFGANPGKPTLVNYVFLASEKDLPEYAVLPSGSKILLTPLLNGSKLPSSALTSVSANLSTAHIRVDRGQP